MPLLTALDLERVIFFDIETVSQYPSLAEVPEAWQPYWAERAARREIADRYETSEDAYAGRAAIFSEFGKICCISVGILHTKGGKRALRVKSYADEDERALLQDFLIGLEAMAKKGFIFLCGHNIREFDVPYICRRLLINRMAIPPLLDFAGKKPWEVKHLIDTLELWKFGDFKSFTKLNLLCALFEIPSPKEDMDGSQVGPAFWEGRLEEIAHYCEKDVLAVTQLMLRWQDEPLLEEEQIESATM
jgi:hypothetical protein